MQNQKYELGEKIRKLREEKNLTRETFCNDESELTIRQLARIEMGESFPSFSKLKYISSTLGVPISVIIDEAQMILPSRYLELKHRLIHFMTYGDEERMNLKDALFSEIYIKFFDNLPEEEQITIKAMQTAFTIFSTEKADYGEALLEEYFDQLLIKKNYSLNDLLIIKLFLFMCLAGAKDIQTATQLVQRMMESIDYSSPTCLYVATRNLVTIAAFYYQEEKYTYLHPYLSMLDEIVQETQDFQQKLSIDLMKATYVLFVDNDLEKATKLFHQAIICTQSFGDTVLEKKISGEMEKHLKKYQNMT